MLAYVFWHWKQDSADAADYERRQRGFHAAMQSAPPSGYHGSLTAGIEGAPWANDGAPAYEDWYFVDDFASLGILNEAAISASRSAPHDAAAALAKGGSGGVYRLRCEKPLLQPVLSYWFSKPDGISYAQLSEALLPLCSDTGAALYMRQMVLGPAPEFCIQSTRPLSLPSIIQPRVVPMRTIWPLPSHP